VVSSVASNNFQRAARVVAWLAVGVQAVQVLYFFVKGLGWAGFWYQANLVQGVAFLVTAVVLAVRRPVLAILVPVVSFLVMVGIEKADEVMTERACSAAAKAAVRELGPHYTSDEEPGDYSLAFGKGCYRIISAREPITAVLSTYEEGARKAGWEITSPRTVTRVEVSNDAWTVEVKAYPVEQGLFEVLVHPRQR